MSVLTSCPSVSQSVSVYLVFAIGEQILVIVINESRSCLETKTSLFDLSEVFQFEKVC